jgi:hypothetical protein
VADLGEGTGSDRSPLREKFFDFSQQKPTKNEFILPRMDLKKWFLLTTAPLFENSALPFQNPRSATVTNVFLTDYT